MIKKMEQAVKAGDSEAARALIVQELWEHPGRPATLDMVTYAMENMPDLFDEEVGTLVIEERENWDEEYRESLAGSLAGNFSRDRLKLFTEVSAALVTEKTPHAESVRDKGYPTVAEVEQVVVEDCCGNCRVEVVERVRNVAPPDNGVCAVTSGDTVLALAETAERIEDHRINAPEHGKAAKIAGYVMMGAGAVAAVVGLCVKLTMLLGIGIGLILVGSAVVYNAIRNCRR